MRYRGHFSLAKTAKIYAIFSVIGGSDLKNKIVWLQIVRYIPEHCISIPYQVFIFGQVKFIKSAGSKIQLVTYKVSIQMGTLQKHEAACIV